MYHLPNTFAKEKILDNKKQPSYKKEYLDELIDYFRVKFVNTFGAMEKCCTSTRA